MKYHQNGGFSWAMLVYRRVSPRKSECWEQEKKGKKKSEPTSKFQGIHPRKLTCPLKINGWKMYFLLKQFLFRGHVSFRGSMFLSFQGWYLFIRASCQGQKMAKGTFCFFGEKKVVGVYATILVSGIHTSYWENKKTVFL